MTSVVEEYKQLVKQQETLEEEIGAIVAELTSGPNAPGVNGPLVDAEGFPRADIDVYRVRHQRHNLAVKQTDHRMTMKRIEEILPFVFEAKMKDKQQSSNGASTVTLPPSLPTVSPTLVTENPTVQSGPKEVDAADRVKKPFAVVANIQNDSPAEWAGLSPSDQVIVFGTADATNHRNLEAIKDIVMRNIGSPIRVIVRRSTGTGSSSDDEWAFFELTLTPQQWSGPGVLGCLLQPMPQENRSSSP